jgi:hypothetical protein
VPLNTRAHCVDIQVRLLGPCSHLEELELVRYSGEGQEKEIQADSALSESVSSDSYLISPRYL